MSGYKNKLRDLVRWLDTPDCLSSTFNPGYVLRWFKLLQNGHKFTVSQVESINFVHCSWRVAARLRKHDACTEDTEDDEDEEEEIIHIRKRCKKHHVEESSESEDDDYDDYEESDDYEDSDESDADESPIEVLYDIEKIINCRTRKSEIQYLVKWQGYSSAHNSWEPLKNLIGVDCPQLISNFHLTHLC